MGLVLGKKSKKRISFRVPIELWEKYQNVKKLAAEKGFVYDPTPELIDALKHSLDKAYEELQKITEQEPKNAHS